MSRRIPGHLDYNLLMPAKPAGASTESESGIPVEHRPPVAALDDYQHRATMHRPTCVRCIEIAARDLQRQGLTAYDIATALRISVDAVRALLAERGARP